MKKAIRGFTLVELAVVISVIMILSVMVLVGVTNARQGEGLKADYLGFYDDLQSLKLRANLGQQNGTSSVQVMTFTLGGSSYSINGSAKSFRNRSLIKSVNGFAAGTVTISFVPQGTDYEGTIPPLGVFAVFNSPLTAISSPMTIVIQGPSGTGVSYTVMITGTGYFINRIDR